jgi:hypothetical protein
VCRVRPGSWICTRLAELHYEGSESPCWDIGYCKEREIRELQEKQRQEEVRQREARRLAYLAFHSRLCGACMPRIPH